MVAFCLPVLPIEGVALHSGQGNTQQPWLLALKQTGLSRPIESSSCRIFCLSNVWFRYIKPFKLLYIVKLCIYSVSFLNYKEYKKRLTVLIQCETNTSKYHIQITKYDFKCIVLKSRPILRSCKFLTYFSLLHLNQCFVLLF